MIKKCKNCNKDFIATKQNIFLCSSECKLIGFKKSKKQWSEKNKNYFKNYRLVYKPKIKKYQRIYYKKNKNILNKKNRIYYSINKDKIKIYQKQYYQKNKNQLSKKQKLYRLKNKNNINKQRRNYFSNRRNKDIDYNIKMRIKTRLRESLNKYIKNNQIPKISRTHIILQSGLKFKDIIKSLKPFPKKIKDYHIHHKKPLNSFIFVNPDKTINYKQIKLAFNPNNLILIKKREHLRTESYGKSHRKV